MDARRTPANRMTLSMHRICVDSCGSSAAYCVLLWKQRSESAVLNEWTWEESTASLQSALLLPPLPVWGHVVYHVWRRRRRRWW